MNRFLSTSLATLALFLVSVPHAHAHATLETGEAVAGSIYKGIVRIGHGCDGSPTLSVKVKIPEGIVSVKPMPKAGWDISIIKTPLAQPYESHGKTITEGVSEIIWSGGKLLDEHYDEFVFRGSISARAEVGSMLYIPVTQTCEAGQAAWIETPNAGEDGKNLKFPAPALKITAAKNTIKIGDITVAQPWSKEMPTGAKVAGGYMSIKNGGATADKLIAVESAYAHSVEIHEMSDINSVMTMRKLEAGLEIKAGETIQFAPKGYHIMFMGVKEPAKLGSEFPAILVFEKAGRMDVMFKVQAFGAQNHSPNGSMEHKH